MNDLGLIQHSQPPFHSRLHRLASKFIHELFAGGVEPGTMLSYFALEQWPRAIFSAAVSSEEIVSAVGRNYGHYFSCQYLVLYAPNLFLIYEARRCTREPVTDLDNMGILNAQSNPERKSCVKSTADVLRDHLCNYDAVLRFPYR